MREGVLAITVAEWTRDIALILSGVAGLLHWGWWFPVLFGAIAAVVREASQGFALSQHCGSGYLIRFITIMDWNRVQGSWKQLEGKIKAKWAKLTADDLTAPS